MPSVILSPPMYLQFTNATGTAPLVGGKLFTYAAGTSTKQATYTDSTGSVANSNPIILDSAGVAVVFLDQSLRYKFVLSPANDTDPPSSPIRTVDGIQTQAQQFYAVDTGSVNAIAATISTVLSYTAGLRVEVKVANTNTATVPTLNINALGATNIVDQYGVTLVAGQLLSGGLYTFEYDGAVFRVMNAGSAQGSYTATCTGYASLTTTVYYTKNGNAVTLEIRAFSGTSNGTGLTLTGAPTGLFPTRSVFFPVPDGIATDNGTVQLVSATPAHAATGAINTGGVITFYRDNSASGWTGSGTKSMQSIVFTYNLA